MQWLSKEVKLVVSLNRIKLYKSNWPSQNIQTQDLDESDFIIQQDATYDILAADVSSPIPNTSTQVSHDQDRERLQSGVWILKGVP